MKIKIDIKDRWTGEILFELEEENNTVKDTLIEAVKSSADLRSANLSSANLRSANLYGAENIPLIPFACPSDGSFIGWKKVLNYLIELEIPATAKRSSAMTSKCRCDKAKVLGITSIADGSTIDSIVNDSYHRCEYVVGEMVFPDSYDEDRWNECSHGIHFFINKQEAIDY